MFTKKELDEINPEYFEIIQTSSVAVTLKSKCTGHEWHILGTEGSNNGRPWKSCRISHRHNTHMNGMTRVPLRP